MLTTEQEQEGETRKDFFEDVDTTDLQKMTSAQITDTACCETKRLAMTIFNFCRQNQDFPYNDLEIIQRAEIYNLTDDQMKPYNELAIKLMRKFSPDKAD